MRVDTPKYKTSDEVDFVIVGSGAAGGIMAKELSTNGFRVVVLEPRPLSHRGGFRSRRNKSYQRRSPHQQAQAPAHFVPQKRPTKKPSPSARSSMDASSAAPACTSLQISGAFTKSISSSAAKSVPSPVPTSAIGPSPTPISSPTTLKWNGKSVFPAWPAPARSIRRAPSRIPCRRFP